MNDADVIVLLMPAHLADMEADQTVRVSAGVRNTPPLGLLFLLGRHSVVHLNLRWKEQIDKIEAGLNRL